ncbi:MAG: PspA/IM30 family protein [Synechococcus sp.]
MTTAVGERERPMGLFDRVSRVVKSNLNAIVSKAEDPEKILEQTIEEMRENQAELRHATAQAIASEKKMERKFEQAQEQVKEWQRKAQVALQKNREDLAREALMRKKGLADSANTIKQQLDRQSEQVNVLRNNLMKLESKMAEAKTKKDMLIARARSAKASQQINEVMGRVDTTSAFAAFERMEEKVDALEAESAAISELSGDSLDSQFAALESGTAEVDIELEELKMQMQLEAAPDTAALPKGSTSAVNLDRDMADKVAVETNKQEVDEELEALRSEIDGL